MEDTQIGSSNSSALSPHNDVLAEERDGTQPVDTLWRRSTLSQCLKNKWTSPVFPRQVAPSHIQNGDPVIPEKPLDPSGHCPKPVEVQPQMEMKHGDKRKAAQDHEVPAKKVYQQRGCGSFRKNDKDFVCPQKKCQEKFVCKDELIIHFRTKHKQCRGHDFGKYSLEGNYCELCEEEVCPDDQANSNTKLLHLIRFHPSLKKHYCTACEDFKMFCHHHGQRRHNDSTLAKKFLQRCNEVVKDLFAGKEGFLTSKNTFMETRNRRPGQCTHCTFCSPEDSTALDNHLHECVYKSDAMAKKGGANSNTDQPSTTEEVQESEQRLFDGKGKVVTYKKKEIEPDVESAYSTARASMKKQIEAQLEKSPVVKLHTEANVLMKQQLPIYEEPENPENNVFAEKVTTINSGSYTVSKASDIDEVLDEIAADSGERAASMNEGPSNFCIQDVINLKLNVYNANRLETASYIPLPPKLEKKVLRPRRPPALINPHNDDAFCFLRNIAIFLDEKKAAAKKGESLKKRLYDVSKEMEYTHETYFMRRYGKTFLELKKKVEHIEFPFEINKRNLARLLKSLGLEDHVINVFQWDELNAQYFFVYQTDNLKHVIDQLDGESEEVPPACAEEPSSPLQALVDMIEDDDHENASSNNQEDDSEQEEEEEEEKEEAYEHDPCQKQEYYNLAVQQFEESQIDLLVYHSDVVEVSHSALIVDIHSLFYRANKHKCRTFKCRTCQQSFNLLRTYKNHVFTTCPFLNPDHLKIIFPRVTKDEDGQDVIPTVKESRGSTITPFWFLVIDVETFYAEKKTNKNGSEEEKMLPLMSMVQAFPLFKPDENDPPDIAALKEAPLPYHVREGLNCVRQTMEDTMELAKEIKRRQDLMRKKYEKVKLSPEQEAIFQSVTNCDLCGYQFPKDTHSSGIESNDGATAAGPSHGSKRPKFRTKVRDHCHYHKEWKRPAGRNYEESRPLGQEPGQTGRVLCNVCNTLESHKSEVFCISHNGTNFDHNYFCAELMKSAQEGAAPLAKEICTVPLGLTKYMEIRWIPYCEKCQNIDENGKVSWKTGRGRPKDQIKRAYGCCYGAIIFHDFMKIAPFSLSKLTAELKRSVTEDKKPAEQVFPILHQELDRASYLSHVSLEKDCLGKTPIPYSNFTSVEYLDETSLPSIEEWKDPFLIGGISPQDYAFAQHVWQCLEGYVQEKYGRPCQMRDYLEFYLRSDIGLLGDHIFTMHHQYRKDYGHSLCTSITIASFMWSVAKRMIPVKLEAITDPACYEFFSDYIGGFVTAVKRHESVLPESSNDNAEPNKENNSDNNHGDHATEIVGADYTSLYPTQLSAQSFPMGDFKVWDEPEVLRLNHEVNVCQSYKYWDKNAAFTQVGKDGEVCNYGMMLKVDCTIPKELHRLFEAYPPIIERKIINFDQLSWYQKDVYKKLKRRPDKVPKIVSTLDKKHGVTLHYMYVRLLLELGVQIDKITDVCSFRQAPYMSKIIDFNADKRRKCETALGKQQYKLNSNIIWGKSVATPQYHLKTKMIMNAKDMDKAVKRVDFKSYVPFGESMGIANFKKSSFRASNTIYIGMYGKLGC